MKMQIKKRVIGAIVALVMVAIVAIPAYAATRDRDRTGIYYEGFDQYSLSVEGSIKENTDKKVSFKVVPKKNYVLVKNIDYASSGFIDVINVEISRSKTFRSDRCIIASGSVSGGYAKDSVKIYVGKKTTHALKKGKTYYIRAYASQRIYTKDKKLWIECPNIETMKVKTFKAK